MALITTKRYDKSSEKKWQKFWREREIFRFDPNSEKPIFSIDTPPPTVSGFMHMGHAFSYSHIDFIARFKRMKGYNVFFPFGFDDNGLATERFIEKKCKIRAKDLTRQEFINLCLKETVEVEKELTRCWASLGISVDWNIFYRTIEDRCRRISQKSFIDIYKQGRAYQKEAPTIWCPTCETAIAQAELKDEERDALFVEINFILENGEKINIATTRPELLPACVAVFVHPDDERYKKLVGTKAKVPLFDFYVPIIADERADPEKGTGIVMCCTFGDQTDMEWWKAYNLPLKIAITQDGKMNELAGKYKGMSVKDARMQIIQDLKNAGLFVSEKRIKHSVNTHERCGTEIEFLVTKQWFIKYLDLKQKFLDEANKINWYPSFMKARYDNWVQNLQWDWCISRQRYFGVPFPIWYCKKCGEVIIADEKDLPVDPLQDRPKHPCPKCGSTEFEPEKDVLDTWATSSLTPMIVGKWIDDPDFFKKIYPMSLRPQAHDIITFWAFTTIVKGLLHTGQVPWKDIMISGHALDEHGKKMSKSKGNVVDPMETIKKFSADCLRLWAASSKLGEDLPFQEKELVSGQRFLTKLWNASRFVINNLESYEKTDIPHENLRQIDKWILSKMNTMITQVTKHFETYNYCHAKQKLITFFWHDFCDDYLEIVKDRLYNPEKYDSKSVESAKYTLYNILLNTLKMLAPIIPHITEEIYQLYFKKYEGHESIHISPWPEPDDELISIEFEEMGDLLSDIISSVRKYKTENNMAMNAELSKLTINAKKAEEEKLSEVIDDLKAVLKIKEVEFGSASKITTERFGIILNIEK